jgi:acetylornithine/N-succinyldiaminopimelate aminotransferase
MQPPPDLPYLAGCYRHSGAPFVRGEGCRLEDETGRVFLDLGAGVAVSALGHGHPALVHAISEQAEKLLHISNLYRNPAVLGAAERIAKATGLSRVFLCNSGAEAIEAALKLARRWFQVVRGENRSKFVCAEHSFHGRTFGALSATGQPAYHKGFEPLLPGFSFVPFGSLDAMDAAVDSQTAAILVEPLQGEGGVVLPPPGYLQSLKEMAAAKGCLLILDEIQTGVGRTGTFLAQDHEGVKADIVTLAKGLAGGLPLGAMVHQEYLAEAFVPGAHASTFGGNPVCCAAACALLDLVDDPDFLSGVLEKGATAQERLCAGLQGNPHVLAIRGRGLLIGVELDTPAADSVSELFRRGVLVTRAGKNVLRLSPPLVITQDELEEGCAQVVDAIWDMTGRS